LFGIFPVMRRSDENVWRSAAGRHAAELLVLAPWFGRSTHVTWAEGPDGNAQATVRSEEHTSELQSRENLVCRLLLEKKKDPNLGIAGRQLAPISKRGIHGRIALPVEYRDFITDLLKGVGSRYAGDARTDYANMSHKG